jgi:ABC-type transporter Mla MlaB component
MKRVSKGVAYLRGNLNHIGVTNNIIHSLAVSLQKVELSGEKNLRIDCGRIKSADLSGLQLLYVWMHCARFRGVEPELINMSDTLQHSMQSVGIGNCFSGFNTSLTAI